MSELLIGLFLFSVAGQLSVMEDPDSSLDMEDNDFQPAKRSRLSAPSAARSVPRGAGTRRSNRGTSSEASERQST